MNTTLNNLVAALNRRAIEQCTHFAVHSGVVATGDRVIALPAESGHGKSTLTAALVQQGFDYVSDEALIFGDRDCVVPYPKPLALDQTSQALLGLVEADGERLFTADDLGGGTSCQPGRVSDIVVAEFGNFETRLTELKKSAGQTTLIRMAFNHYKDPQNAFLTTSRIANQARTWSLTYDNPKSGAALLAELKD